MAQIIDNEEIEFNRDDFEGAWEIRESVFINEQGFVEERDEYDDMEETIHITARINGELAGCARVVPGGEDDAHPWTIGRFAIKPEFRRQRLGAKLVWEAERIAWSCGAARIVLHAQCRVAPFYQQLGYKSYGSVDKEEHVAHIWMGKNRPRDIEHIEEPNTSTLNEQMHKLGAAPSAIRELFAYGIQRKAEIGEENVFDFSLGNPSIPAPAAVADAIRDLLDEDPGMLHGYTPAQGLVSTRQAVADNLNSRYGTAYGPDEIYMTMGAAASLACTLKGLVATGDEVIVIAPYFPEYKMWIEATGATRVKVNARPDDFQLDIEAISKAINEHTRAIIINSPNNPTGTVYSPENLAKLASVLRKKSAEFENPIYLISDEPYREIVYGYSSVSWIPSIYADTIVCYSWSKSLSLPGERIGYVLVPSNVTDSQRVYLAICGAGRALGYVCAPALFQRVIERCVGESTNVEAYDENRQLICSIMEDVGFDFVEPRGAFYLWVKSPDGDARAFADCAKGQEILFVPSSSFGVEGWVRIGYCVSREVIENSREAFAKLKATYSAV